MKITVTGAPGEGKTTIAKLISDCLRAHGFHVVEADLDIAAGCDHPELQPLRLDALLKKSSPLVVSVETAQPKKQ